MKDDFSTICTSAVAVVVAAEAAPCNLKPMFLFVSTRATRLLVYILYVSNCESTCLMCPLQSSTEQFETTPFHIALISIKLNIELHGLI